MTTPTSRLSPLFEHIHISCPQCGYDLRQNVSGKCPECGSQFALQLVAVGGPGRRSITGALAYARVGLILIPLTLFSIAFVHNLLTVLPGRANEQVRNILLVTFGVATVLGVVALGSLFVVQRIHFLTSILFFGLSTFINLVNIVSEILLGTTYVSPAATITAYASMSGMLSMGIVGLIVETVCDRKSRTASQIAFSVCDPKPSS